MFKKIQVKYYKTLFQYLIVPIIIGLLIVLMSYPEGIFQPDILLYMTIYSYSIGIPFMAVSNIIEKKLNKRIRWLDKPNKRFLINVLLEILLTFILIAIIHYIFLYKIRGDELEIIFERTINAIIYASTFIIIGIVIKNTTFFLKNWRQAAVNEEKLKREILTVEYEALKNQVNPHFLFNNLTALSSLVYKNPDNAAKFVNQLAEVYRYILEHGKDEVVALDTEKKLLDNFIYLYYIRYEKGLVTEINIPEGENKYIVPMALQILLENAIKHNTLSPDNPLTIGVNFENDYIIVWNNLQLKTTVQHSGKMGLNNIRLRYKYLTDKKVIVEKTEKYFLVKIPVLNKKP